MKWSSFKENLFSFFPHYYKENDTYKNDEGKGILERFIEVCSEYFDNEVIPDIDNFISCIDVDKTSPILLNYLWEYFGYIPYAYGLIVNGEPYTKENLQKWLLNSKDHYPSVNVRKLLKYAISLYKIRCTHDFYTILGKFYGVQFIVTDPTENDNPNEGSIGISGTSSWEVKYDKEFKYDSHRKYDSSIKMCWECTQLEARIVIPQGTLEWLEVNGNIDTAKEALIEILNKYLPIHAKPFTTESITLEGSMSLLEIWGPPPVTE